MTVESQELKFRTHREGEILDITDKTQRVIESSSMRSRVGVLFVPGSTGALTTIEYEPGLLADLPVALERLAPKDASYEHEKRWHDGKWTLTCSSLHDRARLVSAISRQEANS